MVNTCWVKDYKSGTDDYMKVSFYTIPVVRKFEEEQTKTLSEMRRRAWLANIKRKELQSKHSIICPDHFIQEEHVIAKTLLDWQHCRDSSFVQDGEESTDDMVNTVCSFTLTLNINSNKHGIVHNEMQYLIIENALLKYELSS
ncbi:hypothetical protein ACJMK2_020853 [Sinanodonta woodiana]|uniref:THAP-type domain-containing protein n=1 Tax=Sinanodonta woodiana TaxID=1069815 RepID=A0ABD3U301_SINWO